MGRAKSRAKITNAHMLATEKYFAFLGIPSPFLKRETCSPKRGCLITHWYIFFELRKKHPAARIINIVVGRPGTMMPNIPIPLRTIPMENQKTLSAGYFPACVIFFPYHGVFIEMTGINKDFVEVVGIVYDAGQVVYDDICPFNQMQRMFL